MILENHAKISAIGLYIPRDKSKGQLIFDAAGLTFCAQCVTHEFILTRSLSFLIDKLD